jgi:hypothetical protein
LLFASGGRVVSNHTIDIMIFHKVQTAFEEFFPGIRPSRANQDYIVPFDEIRNIEAGVV